MATFTNQATLTYNGVTTTSNIASGEILGSLSVTKTAVGDTYAPGEDITYIISITNTGTAALSGLTLTDDLGAYESGDLTLYPLAYVPDTMKYYVNDQLQPAPVVTAGPPLTVTGVAIPAGGSAMLIYEAAATEFAPPAAGSTVTNTVSVTGAERQTPATASYSAAVTAEPVLSLNKSVSPAVVSENGQLTYTLTLMNTGNAEAGADAEAVITDTFDPILTGVTVACNGTPWTGSEYTYSETTGLLTTAAGAVTVPAATFSQNPDTGAWITTPGVTVLTVTGTI